MSIGNTSLHQSGEIPEIVKLPNGRIRVTRRFHKFTREDVDNANLGSLMGDFGDLDIAGEQISNQGYTNCRLISVEVDTRFNSVSNTDSAVLVKTYETLTAVWTKEQDDEVTSTDNGLRVLERSEVANLDGFPIVQLSSPNGSKVVLSGMGNASNYFVLLVKANSANTIYWRATNEVLATYNGSFTTANTDQWEYKVIYTPISIDQLEIGYDGTNNSTFNLSEFYLVSQSSDWQNNIVESFIEFEVTVDNSSTFTDTVVFTGSNGNTATGTNVQGGGTGSISSPYDEDDVGVATITDGGKTLYLASFQDQTGADNNAQVGRVVTKWAEAGTLNRSEDKVGSQQAITIQAIGEVPATPAGYSLARTDVSDFEGIKTNRYTFLRPSILSVSQERTGGATTVQVRAFELTEAEVDTLLSEVTSSHILISQSESDYDGIVTSQFTYEIDDFEIESQAEDGMEIIVRTELRATDFSSGVIGTSTYKTLFLIEENIDNGNAIKKRTSRYSEAGVLSISPLEEDGFSLAPSYVYVTTGAPASSMTGLVTPDGTTLGTSVTWFEPKVQNVKGFPTYTQQVLTVSIIGNAVKIHSVNKFFTITEPGVMSTGGAFNTAQKSGAATRYPQATKQPRTYRKKATVDVYLTTSNLITESEVAFTEEGVDWCSIGFDSFYTNETDSSASVSSSWRSFPQYLNSSGTTNVAIASSTGVYFAEANSYGAGATTYTTTGIYRVELEKYTRAADGTQLYLKTIVTF
jgi:hypothetical protein